jgi:hypothetical protein
MELNPNVGIQATGPGGRVTLWGSDAAGFLTGLFEIAGGWGEALAQNQPTFSHGQQNTSKKLDRKTLDAYRKGVEGLLKNKDCLKFVTALLDGSGIDRGKASVSKYILGIFDSVRNQGGFIIGDIDKFFVVRKTSDATVRGTVNAGTATVYFNPNMPKQNFVLNTLHELTHLTDKENGGPHDKPLALIARKLPGASEWNLPDEKGTPANHHTWTSYLSNEFNKWCNKGDKK